MAGLVLAIVILSLVFFSTKKDTISLVQTQTSARTAAEPTIAITKKPRQASKVETQNKAKIIQSYANTSIDGKINIDANGQVIIDTDLKNLFDYFMIATGELSLAEIRQELIKYAQQHLTTAQMQQLLAIYDKYQNYLASQNELDARMSADLSQQQRLQILAQFRQDLLGSEMAEAFFAEDEGYAAFVLNKKHLNDQSNGQAIEQQSQWLEAENRATQFQDTVLENKRLAASNLSSEEIQQLRIEKYG